MPDDDPLAALAAQEAGTGEPEPSGNSPEEPQQPAAEMHPILEARFGGDVNKLAEAYAQADAFIGRQGSEMGSEIAELKERLERYEQMQQPAPQPQSGNDGSLPDLTMDQIADWAEENLPEAMAYVAAKSNEKLTAQFEKLLNERLGPVEKTVGQDQAVRIAEGLRRSLGNEMYRDNEAALNTYLKKHPEALHGDTATVLDRLQDKMVRLDWERSRSAGRKPAAPEPVTVEGGSNGRATTGTETRPLSPEEQLLKDMEPDGSERRDILGNVVRREAGNAA